MLFSLLMYGGQEHPTLHTLSMTRGVQGCPTPTPQVSPKRGGVVQRLGWASMGLGALDLRKSSRPSRGSRVLDIHTSSKPSRGVDDTRFAACPYWGELFPKNALYFWSLVRMLSLTCVSQVCPYRGWFLPRGQGCLTYTPQACSYISVFHPRYVSYFQSLIRMLSPTCASQACPCWGMPWVSRCSLL